MKNPGRCLPVHYRRCSVLLIIAFCAAIASGQDQTMGQHKTAGDINQIQHIVIIVKQNKSFDHYFGAFPGVDGATTGTLSTGKSSTWSPPMTRCRTCAISPPVTRTTLTAARWIASMYRRWEM